MPEFRFPVIGHGGDYNPDQWLDRPDVLEQDVALMREARCNLMSVGIFAWSALEPREGEYSFAWLRDVLDRLHAAGVSVLLATPSGARPAWMSRKYPEVLRVENGRRNFHGGRENHCYTSPVYRAFVTRMNTRLAGEFGAHPAVVGWHISNEYCGECHCELCQSAFRAWLKRKYQTLDNLNHAWWTAFWSKTFTDWEEIHSPEPNGETQLCGLTLDWRRFVSDQTVDFVKCETAPIRRIAPSLPVTINTMGFFYGLDYPRFADAVDFVGYDSYPMWGSKSDYDVALDTSFTFDLVRGFLNKPWSLMECTPSQVNWHEICQLKRPGMHMLSCVQALAHGSDTAMMFQWRKSRGGPEKFHGAVVGHDMTNRTRTFKEVKATGELLETLSELVHSETKSDVALIFDQANRWALDGAQGPRKDKDYFGVTFDHYRALSRAGVNVDVIDMEKPFDSYKLLVAPYLYMLKPGAAERLTAFVNGGGTLVLTFFSGIVDENDLCFLGGAPGPLRSLAGVWAEETDALYDGQTHKMVMKPGNALGLSGAYTCGFLADLLHAETASVQAEYEGDYVSGTPCLTQNGNVWYIASRPEPRFLNDFYQALLPRAGVTPIVSGLPEGMIACRRTKDGRDYTFVLNFTGADAPVALPAGIDLAAGQPAAPNATLPKNGFAVIRTEQARG